MLSMGAILVLIFEIVVVFGGTGWLLYKALTHKDSENVQIEELAE